MQAIHTPTMLEDSCAQCAVKRGVRAGKDLLGEIRELKRKEGICPESFFCFCIVLSFVHTWWARSRKGQADMNKCMNTWQHVHSSPCVFHTHCTADEFLLPKLSSPEFNTNHGYDALLENSGCCHKIAQTGRLQGQKCILSQFWQLEVWDQGASRVRLWWDFSS